MLWKCCTQHVSIFGKLSSGHRTGKPQFSFQSQRKAKPKKVQITIQLHSFSHVSKIRLKILQARLQQYVNWELPDVQAGFRKSRGTRDQTANIHCIIKQRSSGKTSISASLTMVKPLTLWLTTNCGKILKIWEYQTAYLPPENPVCKTRRNRSRDGTTR